jgi:FixJ family two-component response regulator
VSAGPQEGIAPLVLVTDDNDEVRSSIEELLRSVGLDAAGFGSARELLDSGLIEWSSCLILDVRMPGASGLDLQQQLAAAGIAKPIIFVTGYGDISMSVQAMKAGAVDFLTKPFREQTLLDAVRIGIERDAAQRADARIVESHVERFSSLTPREVQVMREVALGRLNKQIAYDLGISEITVKLHRGNVMRKMGAATIGELIRAWELLPTDLRDRFSAMGDSSPSARSTGGHLKLLVGRSV